MENHFRPACRFTGLLKSIFSGKSGKVEVKGIIMYDFIRYSSPLGMLTIAAKDDQLTALVIDGQKYAAEHLAGEGRKRDTPVLNKARLWLDRYFAGNNPGTADLPLAPKGTLYQKKVWQEVLSVPFGQTDTYSAISRRLHTAPRAVGSAVSRNPLLILIPCHRILASDGGLRGYAGGLDNKRTLLRLEGALE